MYKNQLQELAQRSCFNLPAYTCIREGPDHAPRFKAAVNFNGETFESPSYCSTLRQAEHSAAEVALNALAGRGPSNSLAARILDETGVYKNLLQEVSQRVGASLPAYSTFRTGLGHLPVFTCTVELAGVIFTGEPAKNKKQAEKNAAMSAWLSLKSLVQQTETPYEKTHKDEQEHVTVARALQKYIIKARLARLPFPIKFPTLNPRPSNTQQSPTTTSKILPFICPKTARRNRPNPTTTNNTTFQNIGTNLNQPNQPMVSNANDSLSSLIESLRALPQKFPAAGAPPYIPVRHCRIAPPVTIRNTVPVFSAPPLPPPQQPSLVMRPMGMAPPVSIRQAVPVFSPPSMEDLPSLPLVHPSLKAEDPRVPTPATPQVQGTLEDSPFLKLRVDEPYGLKKPVLMAPLIQAEPRVLKVCSPPVSSKPPAEETASVEQNKLQEPAEIEVLKDLKI